ncbi:MAG: NADH-quinone oxidoreductase subunit C [Lachnospiraceae bacterium]|jgi:NADH:ubiquinone oxidoreductase subunit C|nr:NADH-quinone oxidoreductase subunit C [Lachnospiraceae bacterium]MEE1108747.1 NADH-quinone oxidoreductase subunit C [Lachnospiraceae bacterium]MEE3376874.1 NADH-quinone oxidoreductase subunit C [Lachnospiraceae bacterium]MEE3436733.1 NADH-quinone oxidoreductase subunit C [Lachnospiraceae bacterium]MEE3457413.1 NADH-quinone oxidoreductase subunit C [Lachnospiraceae bacterium]
MQEQSYNKISITKEEIVPTAKKMREDGVILAMIHGYIGKDGKPNISYEYQIGTGIESYTVEGEDVLPSIAGIYDLAAEWPERELNELIGVTFEGLDTSKRLFMPDNMLDGQGQILVTPMEELIEKVHTKKEESET